MISILHFCKSRLLALVCISAFISACSSTPKETVNPLPDWVANPPKDNRYLYGVGSAQVTEDITVAFDLATKQANADIANQLRITIQSINTQNTRVDQLDSQQEQVMRSLASFVRVETAPMVLDQTQTANRFQAPQYVYVLQKLDRQRVSARLRQQIADLDQQMLEIADKLLYGTPLVEQWQTLLPVLGLLTERRHLADTLNLYSNQTQAGLPQHVFKLQAKTAQLIREFSIAVDQQGLTTDLSRAVKSSLTKKGLSSAAMNYSASNLTLFMTPTYDSQSQEGRFYVFVNSNATLSDNKGGQLASWSVEARGISAIEEQAKTMANNKLADELAEQVFLWLTSPQLNKVP